MTDARMENIARRLREEEASFIDYPTIETESRTLGFPTSVRTLRFYVAEGVLPPPRRSGKAPVYPRQWILNALLTVHLMKTRLRRSLAEIKRVLQNLNEDPELLAEKCTQLYDLVSQPGNLSQAEAHEVVDDFFGRLLSGGNQPSDVLITALTTDFEERTRKRVAARGFGFQFGRSGGAPTVGEQNRGPQEGGTSTRADSSESFPPAGFREVPKETPATAPGTCSRTHDSARELENIFIRNFESVYQKLESVYHPLDGKVCATRASGREPVIADEYLRVVEILKDARAFDRQFFDRLPLNKSTRFNVHGGGLVNRQLKVAVVGANWSPVGELVRSGASGTRAGGTDLCRILDRILDDTSVFYYVGVHSTVGWEPEVTRYLPRGDHYRVALIEFDDDDVGWRVWSDFPNEAAEVARLFDPDSPEDKVERCLRRIQGMRELQVRGGFVAIDDLAKKLMVPEDLLEEALGRMVRQGRGLKLATVRGQRLLKRDRLSS